MMLTKVLIDIYAEQDHVIFQGFSFIEFSRRAHDWLFKPEKVHPQLLFPLKTSSISLLDVYPPSKELEGYIETLNYMMNDT